MLFFWIGIVSTLLYRAIIIFEHLSGPWVKVSWYIGTIGYIIYFAHRVSIAERREKVIVDHQLVEKIDQANWSATDRVALRYVLGSLRTSKERWNYIVIFASSALAVGIGVILDIFLP